jgi:hypothetical protein
MSTRFSCSPSLISGHARSEAQGADIEKRLDEIAGDAEQRVGRNLGVANFPASAASAARISWKLKCSGRTACIETELHLDQITSETEARVARNIQPIE